MAQMSFNANEVKPDESGDLIPKGVYEMELVESELKPTKSGGEMLSCQFRILDDQPNGNRRVFKSFNLRNPSQQAEQIGQAQFSAFCHACGIMEVEDSQQLHNIAFKGRVTIKKSKDPQYDDQNDISAFQPIDASTPTGSSPAPQKPAAAKPPQKPAASTAKPWQAA